MLRCCPLELPCTNSTGGNPEGSPSEFGDNDRRKWLSVDSTTTGVGAALKGKEHASSEPFITLADIGRDRPYFVKIGKDGVLPALNKLDDHLKAVRLFNSLPRFGAHRS